MGDGVPFAERGGMARGLLDLATGCYPAFLFGGAVRGFVPVFHFHEVTKEWLEPRLQYLAENGYRTVTTDEIARLVIDRVDPGPRAIGLTFDDAWASAWTVAAPLLRRFSLRATLFAIPGRIADAGGVRPTIDQASDPSIDPDAGAGGPSFVTWPELHAMHESGVMDVQSHTRSHAMIFGGSTLAGFVTPAYGREPMLNRPLQATSNGRIDVIGPEALGTPLYARRSRMSDARRYFPDERTADRCRGHVLRDGGAAFFDRPHWRAELEQVAAGGRGRFEPDETRKAAIRAELAAAREELNYRLGTKTVRHVAMPWGVAGSIARSAFEETGHLTAFAERPFRRRGVRAGDDRYQLMRLSSRYLTCLPGNRGRAWFFTTVR
jgi:hypothetical protein